MNYIHSQLQYLTVDKSFPNMFFEEKVEGCFRVIFIHDFQQKDYTCTTFAGKYMYISGLHHSAN
jgi:hypothetical protein